MALPKRAESGAADEFKRQLELEKRATEYVKQPELTAVGFRELFGKFKIVPGSQVYFTKQDVGGKNEHFVLTTASKAMRNEAELLSREFSEGATPRYRIPTKSLNLDLVLDVETARRLYKQLEYYKAELERGDK